MKEEKISNTPHIIDKAFDAWNDLTKFDVFYLVFGFLAMSGVIGLVEVETWWIPAFITFVSMSWVCFLVLHDQKKCRNKSQLTFTISSSVTLALYVMWFVGQGVLWLTTKM